MDYPPNSKSKPPTSEKKVERVTSVKAERRKKSLGKQFKETFISGSAKSAGHYVVFGVLIPAAKDAIADAGRSYIDRIMFGESRGRRGPSAGAQGYISYNRMSTTDRPPMPSRTSLSKRARAQHDFDEIVLPSRAEAEEVIDSLCQLVTQYEVASVADLYTLVGLASSHTDHKWGWTNMQGATVSRIRGSYLLDLPEPEPLD